MNDKSGKFARLPPPTSRAEPTKIVRVVIVDDSATMRATMKALLHTHRDIDVVGEAGDGEEAVRVAERLKPDVVTMDVLMPGVDGITAVEKLMGRAPTRVLVVSSAVETQGATLSMRAVAAGALEVLGKPKPEEDPRRFGARLAEAIRLMAEVPVVRRRTLGTPSSPGGAPFVNARPRAIEVIGIAASTGGPPVLQTLLTSLRGLRHPPVLIAQHLAEGFAAGLARWLGEATGVFCGVAVEGAMPTHGRAYVAPDGRDLVVEAGRLMTPPPIGHHRPSGDRLLSSLAQAHGARVAAMVLSGMGDDGARGLLDVKRAGGLTFAQEPATCVVGGMPAAAIALHAADDVVDVDTLCIALNGLTR